MTRKNFEVFAMLFHPYNKAKTNNPRVMTKIAVAVFLIHYFETINEAFDRTKFLKAAGFSVSECEEIANELFMLGQREQQAREYDVCCEYDGNGCGH